MSKIKLNLSETRGEVNQVWNMGYNTCHCPLLLREDLISHVEKAKGLGFKYIRFHNVFSPRIGIYDEDKNGTPVYNFEKFNDVFDKIIACGMIPFFEISFTPIALGTKDQTLTSYSLNASIPKSYEKWSKLIETLILHVIDRYGIESVKEWYFEVWNEPDIGFFDGEQDDYFRLYDYTALAAKNVSEKIRVGGPATSKCAWIKEFIGHIEAGSEVTGFKRVPCDFISTHAYPSDIAFIDSDRGDVKLQNSNIIYQLYKEVRETMDKSSLRALPLFMGEWNSSAGPLAYNHDEKNNAAFIIKTMNELKDIIDGSLYWNLSDIYEECGFHYTPFHGGYGMINVNSIPKSSFNAFKLLNEIKGKELSLSIDNQPEGCGGLVSLDEANGKLSILLYYYKEPDSLYQGEWNISIEVAKIIKDSVSCRHFEINNEGGSPYEWWQKIGCPDYLTLESMQFLMDKSKMKEKSSILFKNKENNTFDLNEKLNEGDVLLLQINI